MVAFICNICGTFNQVEHFATEPASCGCGSNVRLRALVHLLSMELFGRSLTIAQFPKLKSIRGIGMTDQCCYADRLAEKFDYRNTYYDREPQLDFTKPQPGLEGSCDFILSADVLEHIAPPIENAVETVFRLLKPTGFLVVTIYCNPADQMREHFPDLNDFRIVRLGDAIVIVNRKRDGTFEIHHDPIFHGGPGSTLEMREFGMTRLKTLLLSAGFSEVRFLSNDIPEIGVIFDHDVSQPLIAAKEPFTLSRSATAELTDQYRAANESVCQAMERADALTKQIRMASDSRWLRLGRRFGIGPKWA